MQTHSMILHMQPFWIPLHPFLFEYSLFACLHSLPSSMQSSYTSSHHSFSAYNLPICLTPTPHDLMISISSWLPSSTDYITQTKLSLYDRAPTLATTLCYWDLPIDACLIGVSFPLNRYWRCMRPYRSSRFNRTFTMFSTSDASSSKLLFQRSSGSKLLSKSIQLAHSTIVSSFGPSENCVIVFGFDTCTAVHTGSVYSWSLISQRDRHINLPPECAYGMCERRGVYTYSWS